jgi:ubiquitin C-terminal hydrolase
MHWVGDEKPIYDCYAVTNFGGLGGGHYTAYALHDGGVCVFTMTAE